MSLWPAITIPLTVRCHERVDPGELPVCGGKSSWQAGGGAGIPPATYCDRHRHAGDLPLDPAVLVRRVRVVLVVDFAGVGQLTPHAHTEAAELAASALEMVGGAVSTISVTSTVVQNAPTPAQDVQPAAGGV